jgi:predicted flap endonuclease-1-like 5' DNA nuclease
MADDGRDGLIPPDRQTFEIGGRYIEGEQLDAARARSLVRALTPGDTVQVETPTARGPVGDMRVIDAEPSSGEGSVLVPESGSREYLLVPGNADVGVGSSVVPLRLRLRDSSDSVGTVGEITVEAGDPATAPDTTTSMEPEQESMSSSPARRQVEERYETIGTTEAAVTENIRSIDLPTTLNEYDGIGASTANALNDSGIESPADLAVTVRVGGADSPAYPPLQRALDSINAQQQRAVLDAARTLRDLAVPAPTDSPGTNEGGDSEDEETQASKAASPEPTAQGFTEAEIAAAMESVMKGTEAVVDIDGSEVTVGWQATDETPLDFNRGSAVLTGDTSVLEGLARQATKAYYDNVALSEGTVDAIESAIESAPIDFPDPPTSGARPEESTGDESDDDGITDKSGTNAVLSVDEKLDRIPDEEEQALREMMQRAEDFGLKEEERQFEAAAAIEPLVLERYDDIIQSLLPVDVQYASSSVAGYNIRLLPTNEGEDRIAGLGIMERPDMFVPASKVPDLYDDLDTYISNIDTGRPGNEETKQTLQRLDSLRALEIERGRVDIASLFLDREQIETFAAFHFGSMESNRGVWLGRMMNRIKELSKAMWAAQLMYQSERGDSEAQDFIDAKLSGRGRIRRGSAVWYLDFADRIAAEETFDAVDFVQRWYNAHDRFERRDFSPDDQPPKLEAYRDTPDSGTTTTTTDTSTRDTTTSPTTTTDTPAPDQSSDARPIDDTADPTPDPATTYEVFIVQRGGDRQVGIRVEGADTIMTDSGGDFERRQLLETLGRRTSPGAAAEDVFIGTVEAQGGDIRSSDLVRPLSGVPIEDMEGTDATAHEEPVSDTQVRGSTPEERGSTATSRTAPDETDIGTAEIDSFTAEEVSIDTLDVDIGGDVSLGVDDLDVETVESIEEDIEEDIGR